MSQGNMRLGTLLVIVALIGVGAWLVLRDDGDSSDSSVAASIATEDTLRTRAAEDGAPIYWAGPQAGTELELSVPEDGRTYIRYLTGGAEPGDPRPDFLTVGTYEFAEPVPALEELSESGGGVQRSVPGGGIAYFNREAPESVYLAYPGIEVQIEVYDPDPERAKNLVTSGQIVPVS